MAASVAVPDGGECLATGVGGACVRGIIRCLLSGTGIIGTDQSEVAGYCSLLFRKPGQLTATGERSATSINARSFAALGAGHMRPRPHQASVPGGCLP